MITFEDASALLALAAARDQRTVGRADIHAWHTDLSKAGITRADAENALTAFYQEMAGRPREQRYRATPIDLIDIARRARRERLANLRYDGDPNETSAQYLARLRGRTRALADGRIAPGEGLRALGPGPSEELAAKLKTIGRKVPDDGEAAEDAPSSQPTRVGPLTVRCPVCRAPLGRHCRSAGRIRMAPHGARRRAANEAHGLPVETPDDIAARRAASAAALAQLGEKERAQLDAMRRETTQPRS